MQVIFVSYGRFAANSGGHMARWARALQRRGHAVALVADGRPEDAAEWGAEGVPTVPRSRGFDPAAVLGRHAPSTDRDVVIHAWTPREQSRVTAEALRRQAPHARLVVHLEDDETLLTAAQLGAAWERLAALPDADLDARIPPSLSHPRRMAAFLASADGVSAIVDPLFDLAPGALLRHTLAPGVDADEIGPPLRPDRRAALLQALGVPPHHRILVYPGNLHAANRREVFSLYVAVHVLRRRGWEVTLLRTGDDYGPGLDVAFQHLRGEVSRELGRLPRADMLTLLRIADVLVQPGAPDRFNQRRLPSKLPEFLASGRPVVTPRANLGLRLVDGEEAVLLDAGHGLEIAAKVDALFRNEERAARIGAAGRAFALRHLDWDRGAAALERFYARVLSRARPGESIAA